MDYSNTNIIFLDIDGVLNNPRSHGRLCNGQFDGLIQRYDMRGSGDHVEVKLLNYLKEIISKTTTDEVQTKVVIVSSWATGLDDVSSLAMLMGIPAIGKTSCTGGGTGRGESVYEWVTENNPRRFLIIDDAGSNMYHSWKELTPDFNMNEFFYNNMINCHGAVGLVHSDIAKAVSHFND